MSKSNVIIDIDNDTIIVRCKKFNFSADDHLFAVKTLLESLPESEMLFLGLVNVENEVPKNQFSISNEVLTKFNLI